MLCVRNLLSSILLSLQRIGIATAVERDIVHIELKFCAPLLSERVSTIQVSFTVHPPCHR